MPEAKPTPMDPNPTIRKSATAPKSSSVLMVMPPLGPQAPRSTRDWKSVIATPSFSSDSPNTKINIISFWLRLRLDKTLRMATGSMDEMSEPKMSESSIGMVVALDALDMKWTINPVVKELKTVPTTASIKMAPRRLRNCGLLTEMAASKIMGGSRTLRKRSSSKLISSMPLPGVTCAIEPQKAPTRMHTAASGRKLISFFFTTDFAHSHSIKTPTVTSKCILVMSFDSSQYCE
mmetsp:Transcript_46593/g.141138  ORF Transcript_46593/g.141138 Transcript_46593/m.141138 type:complete len:234 (-) Transcript_46593:950-1651(-)